VRSQALLGTALSSRLCLLLGGLHPYRCSRNGVASMGYRQRRVGTTGSAPSPPPPPLPRARSPAVLAGSISPPPASELGGEGELNKISFKLRGEGELD